VTVTGVYAGDDVHRTFVQLCYMMSRNSWTRQRNAPPHSVVTHRAPMLEKMEKLDAEMLHYCMSRDLLVLGCCHTCNSTLYTQNQTVQ